MTATTHRTFERHVAAHPKTVTGPRFERLYDPPSHQMLLVPIVSNPQKVKAAVVVVLMIAIVLAILLLVAATAQARPKNSHPGNAQPPPVGLVIPSAEGL